MTRSPFGIYVHVPFCASRCGYCDFNTYTATDLGGSVQRDTFHETLIEEIRYAARQFPGGPPVVDTVFFGGGTPTLLTAPALTEVLGSIREEFGLAADAEVTTEANPDSVDQSKLDELRAGGFNRISFGTQSASSRVLQILERTHTPGASAEAIAMAIAAGFDHINADLIIGTPGEYDEDVIASVEMVTDAGVDHVSAYTLIVESGTPLARRVAKGEIASPDDDVAAHRYEIVDAILRKRGFDWYEVSNWSKPGGECRHNLAYWHGTNWWGIGPGAHSHLDGVRWWNMKHPRTYADLVRTQESPAAEREVLTQEQMQMERVMLRVRLAEGMPAQGLPDAALAAAQRAADSGLLDAQALASGTVRLTDGGRLLADAVIRDLLP